MQYSFRASKLKDIHNQPRRLPIYLKDIQNQPRLPIYLKVIQNQLRLPIYLKDIQNQPRRLADFVYPSGI
jgi:hypothetical protein